MQRIDEFNLHLLATFYHQPQPVCQLIFVVANVKTIQSVSITRLLNISEQGLSVGSGAFR